MRDRLNKTLFYCVFTKIFGSIIQPHHEHMTDHEVSLNHSRGIKETFNAVSKYIKNNDGKIEYHINQYVFKKEIGRGSFGAVHMAIDQNGKEYVKVLFEWVENQLLIHIRGH